MPTIQETTARAAAQRDHRFAIAQLAQERADLERALSENRQRVEATIALEQSNGRPDAAERIRGELERYEAEHRADFARTEAKWTAEAAQALAQRNANLSPSHVERLDRMSERPFGDDPRESPSFWAMFLANAAPAS